MIAVPHTVTERRRDHVVGTWSGPRSSFEPSTLEASLTKTIDGAWQFHRWAPHGFSAVRLGDDVSVVLHTWPEHQLATIDVRGKNAVDTIAIIERVLGWQAARIPVKSSDDVR